MRHKILVVDDETMITELLSDHLGDEGYEVYTANGAGRALNGADGKLLVSRGDGHMGIGLPISRLLCRKHGGKLELSNTSEGACVNIVLSV